MNNGFEVENLLKIDEYSKK